MHQNDYQSITIVFLAISWNLSAIAYTQVADIVSDLLYVKDKLGCRHCRTALAVSGPVARGVTIGKTQKLIAGEDYERRVYL